MRAVILAGGAGSRMSPYSNIIPKCLLPVAGVPCVYRIAERMIDQGFNDIVICINAWMVDQFKFALRDLPIQFSVSTEPAGTAGELWQAWKTGFLVNEFLVQYGDDLTEIKYGEVLQFHKLKKADATLATTTNIRAEVGMLEADGEGHVLKFMEKPMLEQPCWTSVAILEPVVFNYLKLGLDMGKDIFPKMLADCRKIYVYQTDADWIDIGNLVHFQRANEIFKKKLGQQ